jgi:hypothetical protein
MARSVGKCPFNGRIAWSMLETCGLRMLKLMVCDAEGMTCEEALFNPDENAVVMRVFVEVGWKVLARKKSGRK